MTCGMWRKPTWTRAFSCFFFSLIHTKLQNCVCTQAEVTQLRMVFTYMQRGGRCWLQSRCALYLIQSGANGADMDTSLILNHAHTLLHQHPLCIDTGGQLQQVGVCLWASGCFKAASRTSKSALSDSIKWTTCEYGCECTLLTSSHWRAVCVWLCGSWRAWKTGFQRRVSWSVWS